MLGDVATTELILSWRAPGDRPKTVQPHTHTFSVAPMMDWTDRHCRFFHRLITRHALLYTEMVTAEAILRGKRDQLLAFSREEHPVAPTLLGSARRPVSERTTATTRSISTLDAPLTGYRRAASAPA